MCRQARSPFSPVSHFFQTVYLLNVQRGPAVHKTNVFSGFKGERKTSLCSFFFLRWIFIFDGTRTFSGASAGLNGPSVEIRGTESSASAARASVREEEKKRKKKKRASDGARMSKTLMLDAFRPALTSRVLRRLRLDMTPSLRRECYSTTLRRWKKLRGAGKSADKQNHLPAQRHTVYSSWGGGVDRGIEEECRKPSSLAR